MKNLFPLLLIWGLWGQSCTEAEQASQTFAREGSFQLASPRLQADSILFSQSANLELDMAYAGASIKYTLDGSPVTEESPLYEGPMRLEASALLKARAYHASSQPSEVIQQQFVKLPPQPAINSFALTPAPKAPYKGRGKAALIDRQRGTVNFRAGQAWLGFQGEPLSASWRFAQPTEVSGLWLGYLVDHGAWIFGPAQVTVSSGNKILATLNLETAQPNQPARVAFLKLSFPAQELRQLRLEIMAPKEIPAWHPGKGTPPWLFLDEIILQ
ncbi:MAG: chitobiase/beta-hexosaminidase C-terminal domain-containing protein [Bacteroidota bacterium]